MRPDCFPNQYTMLPPDAEKVIAGGAELTWQPVDTRLSNVDVLNCPREMTGVRLAIGSNAASAWYGGRQTVMDDGASRRLTLHRGPNIVRAAVINGGGATDFCARFLDADDQPLKDYTISLSEAGSLPRSNDELKP